MAGPCLFPVVAGDQCGIEACNGLPDRGPFPLPVLILGYAGLQTALVFVGAGIADVLVAVGLGKEQPEADAARRFGAGGIEAVGARRLQASEQSPVLVEQRLAVGAEIGRRDAVFVWTADFRRKRVGEVLVGAHLAVARKVERLPRQIGQTLF